MVGRDAVLKKQGIILICILLLMSSLCVPIAAIDGAVIRDEAEMLTPDEESALAMQLARLSAKTGCSFAVWMREDAKYDFSSGAYMDKIEAAFLAEEGGTLRDNRVLLIVTRTNGIYRYNMFLHGNAENKINDKEVDYILDDEAVYDNLKSGKIFAGVTAFAELAAKGYSGRVGASYAVILIVSFCIALAVAIGACVGVKISYGMKRKSIDYPLDRFAKLKLTEQNDVFTGSFVTKRVIQTGNGSSGGRGGGGGARGGHAGGR